MSWLFSQALVAEYLAATSSDGEPYAQLSGNPIPQAYCAPDKMTDFSRLSRFGMTYKPLTESHGKELLTWYLGASHAKISQPPGKAQELTESGQECGVKWHASFTKYDPSSSSWKTHQCSLLGDLDEFSETWPQWGLMRNGECWEQRTLEQNIRGTGFGLSENEWPTPTCHNSNEKESPSEFKRDSPGLGTVVLWFPTPQASDNKDRGNMSNPSVQRRIKIGKQISLSQSVDRNSGLLNPTWVEWLMGWPLEWTDLKPLGTDKSHFALQPLANTKRLI
jgi:hypothetical protein